MTRTSTPTQTFAEFLAELPFHATTQTGTGFFVPLWRAAGHLTHLLAMLNEDDVEVTDDQALAELDEAIQHTNGITLPEGISTAARTQTTSIINLTNTIPNEYISWTEEDRKTNLRNAIQRYAGLIAYLDRELTGLTGSDPGTSF